METELPTMEALTSATELKQKIKAVDVTVVPAVAVDALAKADDPDCTIDEFVQVIERDAALVADILAISNSSAFRVSREIESVHQAVIMVGMRECKNLIVSASMKALSRQLPASVEWSRTVLWQHALQTASIARSLNKRLPAGFEGEEFSAAIVHDIGRLLVALASPNVFEVVDRLTFAESPELLAHEQALMGCDHCELGAWFADEAGLPELIVDCIRHHHRPSEANNVELTALVALADDMSNHLWRAGTPEDYSLPEWIAEYFANDPSDTVSRVMSEMSSDESMAAVNGLQYGE